MAAQTNARFACRHCRASTTLSPDPFLILLGEFRNVRRQDSAYRLPIAVAADAMLAIPPDGSGCA